MTDDEKKAVKDVAEVSANTFGNLALAFLASFAASTLCSMLGVPDGATSAIGMGLFLAIIFADPIEVWRGDRSWRKFGFYAVCGIALSVFIDVAIGATTPTEFGQDAVEDTTTIAEATPQEGATDKGFPWFLLVFLLIGPLTFAMPLLEKILNIDGKTERPSSEDLAIDAQFPIFLAVTSSLHLLIPGALWLIGASIPMAAAVYLAGIILVVMDVAYSPEEDSARDLQEQWGPRPETATESWSNLRKGLGQCLASALFIGSTIYLGLQSMSYEAIDFDEAGAFDILGPLLMSGGIMLVITLTLFALGAVITAMASYGIGKLRFGTDTLSIIELGQRSVGRLFAGGMSWVRPNLERD